jgi:hypothetical protein
MKYGVVIPGWQMDQSLTIRLEAENESEAYEQAVAWVNAYAGYHYCDKLPIDTKVVLEK